MQLRLLGNKLLPRCRNRKCPAAAAEEFSKGGTARSVLYNKFVAMGEDIEQVALVVARECPSQNT